MDASRRRWPSCGGFRHAFQEINFREFETFAQGEREAAPQMRCAQHILRRPGQRIGAKRRPMTGSGRDPYSRCVTLCEMRRLLFGERAVVMGPGLRRGDGSALAGIFHENPAQSQHLDG